ncbi:hypothetical protein Tco_1164926 [Tanacetum coccineum]
MCTSMRRVDKGFGFQVEMVRCEAKMKMVVAAVMFGGGGWEVVDEGDVSGDVREVMVMTSAAGGDEGEVAFRVAVGSW